MEPIGFFHCQERYSYDAPRQSTLSASLGRVELLPGRNFEQALTGLSGFSRLWLLYLFDRNPGWKPMVRPPRGSRKVGVFASRSPHRPNPLGLSCVELLGIDGLSLAVRGHDLLDGTPILDIKPYLPYADAFPEARSGWLEELDEPEWTVRFLPAAERQLAWLERHGLQALRGFLERNLALHPLDASRRRLSRVGDGLWRIAYRTWRAEFRADAAAREVTVRSLASGYTPEELAAADDRYADKPLHLAYQQAFAGKERP